MSADIRVSEEGARAVVVVSGELDIATCPELDDVIARVSAAEIVLDLAGVTFMGSSGLASLMKATRRAESLGGSLVLRAPSPAVVDLLEMTRLRDRFTIDDQ